MWITTAVLFVAASNIYGSEARNSKPIIGILAQEAFSIRKHYPDENVHSYIAASYVKFVESAGGRVLPVMIGKDKKYYENVVDKTNGLLLPGGATWFNESNGYADAGLMLYDHAVKLNNQGDFYPIWGTCLGMELLAMAPLNGKEIRSICSSKNISLPLKFTSAKQSSRLFSNAPNDILKILATENVTVNSHGFCFTEQSFAENGLDNVWKVLSTNYDKGGLEFISSYEHVRLPFYGVQFHPEKNIFEFEKSKNTLHTLHAIQTSQYFANFFVEECRSNNHDFEEELKNSLIYKYNPRYSGNQGSIYEQVYIFNEND